MINILCFGDSNTHGTQPMASIDDRSRWSAGERWPGVVQAALGPGYHIIEEGLPGRTTVFDDPLEGAHKNGRRYLAACLESHWPLDIVVLMLGVNDLKARFGLTPFDIAMGMGALAADVKSVTGASGKAADVLILAAPPIRTTGWTALMFAGGEAKSRMLAPLCKEQAARQGAGFLDLGTVASVSLLDGIHFDAANHRAIGAAVASFITARAAASGN